MKTIERLTNDDLEWDGTHLGLQPRLRSQPAERLVTDPAISSDELRGLLRDPRRFALAHVLLTYRRGTIESFDASRWNGLRVHLDPSGRATYEDADMERLAQYWTEAAK